MLAEVKVLIEGFTNSDLVSVDGEERTQATITLIKDNGIIMVVDPGILESQEVLIEALGKENINVNDVNVVIITHSHLDHYRNIGLFPKAKVLDFFGLWESNTIKTWDKQFTPNIQIIKTPGHDYTGITILANTKIGVVAVCGDIFWKQNYPEKPEDDPYASDVEKLKLSRKKIIRTADWIIPGHEDIYKNIKPTGPTKKWLEAPVKKKSDLPLCSKCGLPIRANDKCLCRPRLCFRCCECGYDCRACGCNHKK